MIHVPQDSRPSGRQTMNVSAPVPAKTPMKIYQSPVLNPITASRRFENEIKKSSGNWTLPKD